MRLSPQGDVAVRWRESCGLAPPVGRRELLATGHNFGRPMRIHGAAEIVALRAAAQKVGCAVEDHALRDARTSVLCAADGERARADRSGATSNAGVHDAIHRRQTRTEPSLPRCRARVARRGVPERSGLLSALPCAGTEVNRPAGYSSGCQPESSSADRYGPCHRCEARDVYRGLVEDGRLVDAAAISARENCRSSPPR